MMRRLIFFGVLLVSPSLSAGSPPRLAETGFTSAKVCGECHVAIYEGWKESLHANAVSDPVFYSIFLETSRQTKGASDTLCLSCHAPTVRVTKDTRLDNPLTQEGVTCDFCHSVTGVKPGSAEPYSVVTGRRKSGPLKGTTSPVHETAYSDLYEKAELCGGCHEYTNAKGAPILETYSEWKQGPYAKEGKSCQTCHMPPLKELVVPPRVQPTKEIYINSHEAAGGHFAETVKKAVILRLGEVRRDGEKIHAVVRLENVGSGHKVPTGLPTRRLVLTLQALVGGTPLYSEERVFEKVLVDAKGAKVTKDADLFLTAVKVIRDNRLEPRKPREEHFSFYAPEGKRVDLRVSAYYLYQPRIIQETEMKVEIGSEETVLPVR